MQYLAGFLAVSALGLVSQTAEATVCDSCVVSNDHTKDYSTPFKSPVANFPACQQYSESACCSLDVTTQTEQAAGCRIANGYTLYDTPGAETYDIAACHATDATIGAMSTACQQYFENEYCMYECDVNVSKYRKHKDCSAEGANTWELFNMPIKATYCNDWYTACKDDYLCTGAAGGTAHDPTLAGTGLCTVASGNCQKFSDVFAPNATVVPGEMLCEGLFGEAFVYDTTNTGYTMSFGVGQPNPNDLVSLNIPEVEACAGDTISEEGRSAACGATAGFAEPVLQACQVCHLRNDFTLDVALPAVGLEGTQCSKYANNSCCSVDTSTKIGTPALYGLDYGVNRCYDIYTDLVRPATADKCLRWFTAEECLYECDVNVGKFRKHADCTDASGSNGWQIVGMPIKASECDQMYEDCKDFVMCTCSGADCGVDNGAPASVFAVSYDECTGDQKFCSKTLGEMLTGGKEFCEMVWDGAFVYGEHEADSYSIGWNDAVLGTDPYVYTENPNNAVNPDVPYPANCPGFDATTEMCTAGGAVVVALDNSTATDAASNTAVPAAAAGVALSATALFAAAGAWMLM